MPTESEQFTLLWTKSHHSVAAYVGSLVPEFSDAEDIVQEVALVLMRRFSEYDHERPFVAWAIGIARLQVLQHWNRQKKRPKFVDEELLEKITALHGEMADELDDLRRALELCLRQIEGRRRQALALRYGNNLQPGAIAQALGTSATAIRNLLCRVRSDLRACIERRMRQMEGPA
jgi:RNA polymerase sigma-70 factor (ECF subfamily)